MRTSIFILFLSIFFNTYLFSQDDEFKSSLNDAILNAELKPPKPAKPDLSLENKLTLELTGGGLQKEFREEEDTFFEREGGGQVQLKLKKEIYKDEINSFSIGLAAQRYNLEYIKLESAGEESVYQFSNYYINAHQKIYSLGAVASNRFKKNVGIFGFFLDMELSAFIKLYSEDYLSLYEASSDYDPYGERPPHIPLPIENGIDLSNVVGYFSMSPGIETTIRKRINIYVSYSIGKNINTIYKPVVVNSLLNPVEESFFFTKSFNLGFRF